MCIGCTTKCALVGVNVCALVGVRFQSKLESAFTVYHDLSSKENMTEALKEIEGLAKPLVGYRSKASEKWWPYPLLVIYLGIDPTLDGMKGWSIGSLVMWVVLSVVCRLCVLEEATAEGEVGHRDKDQCRTE